MLENAGKSTSRGAFSLGLASLTNLLLQFILLALLARLLNPDEFGLVGALSLLFVLSDILSDFGVSNSIVRADQLSRAMLKSAYFTGIVIASFFSLLVLILADPISTFIGHPEAKLSIILTAVAFLISPQGQTSKGLLERQKEFKEISIAEVTANLIAAFVAITFALLGAGIISFVIGRLTSSTIKVISYRLLAKKISVAREDNKAKVKYSFQVMSFGGVQTLDSLISYVFNSFGSFVLGAFGKLGALGGFTISFNLGVNIPGNVGSVISRSTLPALASQNSEFTRQSRSFSKILQISGLLNISMMLGLVAIAPSFIPLVYGERWSWVVPTLQILAISGCFRAFTFPLGVLFTAKNKPSIPLFLNILRTVVLIGAILLQLNDISPQSIAWSYVLSSVIAFGGNLFILHYFKIIKFTEYARMVLKVVLITSPGLICSILLQGEIGLSTASELLLTSTCYILITAVLLILSKDSSLKEIIDHLGIKFKK